MAGRGSCSSGGHFRADLSTPSHTTIPTTAPDSLGSKTKLFILGKGVGAPVLRAVFLGESISSNTLISSGATLSTVPIVRDEIFIILDPNGEYSECFQDLGAGCRVFQVPPLTNTDAAEFTLPAWMWNSSEWAAVAQAAPRAQRPLLQEALRNLRSNKQITLTIENRLFARCKSLDSFLLQYAGTGAIGNQNSNKCGQQLTRFWEDVSNYAQELSGDIKTRTEGAAAAIKQIIDNRMWAGRDGRTGFNDFGDTDLSSVGQRLQDIFRGFPQGDGFANVKGAHQRCE